MVNVKRFDVCLIELDPTKGSEIKKTRPCVVISPDSMNLSRLRTIIVAPMTSKIREDFPTRVNLTFNGKKGQIALDQIRTVDRVQIKKNVGHITAKTQNHVLELLSIMFAK